jgi:ABC-type oligopeptide transport system substrate-binding subunit
VKGTPHECRAWAWGNEALDKEAETGRGTRDVKKRLEHYAKAEEIVRSDAGYVPLAWVVRYAVAKPPVRGIERSRAGEPVIGASS